MSAWVLHDETELRDPVLVLAYAGWSDGGEAATTAVQFLMRQLEIANLATLETEEYLDFTVVRPHVRRRGEEGRREIVWPNHEFFAARGIADHDLVLGLGVEPHLRWRSYCQELVELADALGVARAILLGAFLDEVIYSQPVAVTGHTDDADLAPRIETSTSRYEGPTGIVGVLGSAFVSAGLPTVSLWARLPHYVSRSPNPRAALALLQRVERVADCRFDLSELERESAEFDREVSDEINADPQLSAYVRELKRRAFSQ